MTATTATVKASFSNAWFSRNKGANDFLTDFLGEPKQIYKSSPKTNPQKIPANVKDIVFNDFVPDLFAPQKSLRWTVPRLNVIAFRNLNMDQSVSRCTNIATLCLNCTFPHFGILPNLPAYGHR